MTSPIITNILLPLALAFIMFGMGLGLTKQDFTRLWTTPRAIFIGLAGQLLLLPLLAFTLCILFELPPTLAIGLMILAACPGGTTSNVISQLAKANLALSVTLTAICTLICVFSTPWIIHYAVVYFLGDTAPDYSLLQTAVSLIVITLLPIQAGIMVRKHYCEWALKYERYFRHFSLLFLAVMVMALVIIEYDLLISAFKAVFLACLALNILSIAAGLLLSAASALNRQDAMTLGIEIGIQNSTMAIVIAINFLQQSEYAISAGVYSFTMYLCMLPLIWWSKRTAKQPMTTRA